MAEFRYQAVDSGGEMQRDRIEADDLDQAVALLRDQGLLPVRVEPASQGALAWLQPASSSRRRLGAQRVEQLTRQLARLLRAGMPLDRALSILIGISDDELSRDLLAALQDEVRGGRSFADAIERQGRSFSRLYLNMIRAGEAGGSLEVVLERLAEFLERSRKLRESVISAMIYPIILLSVSVLSILLLLTFVVPQFEQLFADAGRALPLPTQIVILAGDLVRDYWWVGLGLGLTLVAAGRRALQQPSVRDAVDHMVLRLPLFGALVLRVEMARFARTLGTLLGNGVALLTALSIVRETLGNTRLIDATDGVAESVRGGRGLAEPMAAAECFPPLAVHMIRVGEESGELQSMLLQVADTYDEEVQTAVQRLLTLLEPILILGLGVIIAGIILSILVAILSINNLAF